MLRSGELAFIRRRTPRWRISLYNPDQSRAVVAAAMGDTALVAALDRKKKGKSVIGADNDGGNLEVADPEGAALIRKALNSRRSGGIASTTDSRLI